MIRLLRSAADDGVDVRRSNSPTVSIVVQELIRDQVLTDEPDLMESVVLVWCTCSERNL
jgi:hypothetical protein